MATMDEIAASMLVQPQQAAQEAKDAKLADQKRQQRENDYQKQLAAREHDKLMNSRSSQSLSSAAGVGDDDDEDELSGSPAGQEDGAGLRPDRQAPNSTNSILDDADEGSEDDDAGANEGDGKQGEEDDDPLSLALGDADHERDDQSDGDVIDASKLGDDAKLSVTVDGEDQVVTLGELKRRYAGEGAIEKRLQAATEARTQAEEDYARSNELVKTVLSQFGQLMFRRTVQEPDPSLLDRAPAQFYKQKELFDKETAMLTKAQQDLYAMTMQVDEVFNQNRQAQRQQAAQQLRQIMPVFNDPVKGPKVKAALIEAAKEIGYTDAQIAACEDPLMFKTVALAARELRRMKGIKVEKQTPPARSMQKQGQNKGSQPNSAKRQEQAVMQRARKTGSVDDIALTMIEQPSRKKRRMA